ncbi:MAG TPA: hypothetical protein VK041_05735 [Opitutales bacterium]|nr:hypothetical protein [Opitutales bacterium]
MFSYFSSRSAVFRLCALFAFLVGVSELSAARTYLLFNPQIERNFILTGDYETPARDGIPVSSIGFTAVSDGDIELASYRFAWQLERQISDGSWSVVTLANGETTVYSDPEAIVLDSDPDNTETPNSALLNHSGSLKPQARLFPYATYRVVAEFQRRVIFGSWEVVDVPRRTSGQNFYHFINTDSNDTERNVLSTLNSVSVEDPFILDDSAAELYRGFEVKVDATLRRWDRFLSSRSYFRLPVHFHVELRERDSGNLIQVRQPESIEERVYSYDTADTTRVPSTTNLTHTFRVEPLQQIDSRKEYDLRVRISHDEAPGLVLPGNAVTKEKARLYHFNGALDFNGVETTMTYFFRRLPASVTTHANFTEMTLERVMGTLKGEPNWRWDTQFGTPTTIVVQLYPDGTARAHSVDEPIVVMSSEGSRASEINGVRYSIPIAALDGNGMQGTLAVRLPQGIGITDDTSIRTAGPLLPFTGRINNDFELLDTTVSFDPEQTFYVVPETLPVGIAATSVTWDISNGEFYFPTTGAVEYLRNHELSYLESVTGIPVKYKNKKDNSGYYASVTGIVGSKLTIKVDENGAGKIDAEFTFSEGEFYTHFPYGSTIAYEFGSIEFENSVVTGGGLGDVTPFYVSYLQDCPDGDCFDDFASGGAVAIDPSDLFFTPDGGFVGTGDLYELDLSEFILTETASLNWGYIPSMSGSWPSTFAHSLDSFAQGTFHATGHFLPGTGGNVSDFEPGNPAGRASDNGPASIHLSAVDQPLDIARPGSAADRAGTHNYAGVNLRVADESDVSAQAVITGETIAYTPRNCSKFYFRLSGVTGKLEAEPGTFPDALQLAGYQLGIDYYGLGFISNQTDAERSFVQGTIFIPGPTKEKFEFDGLSFTCLGGLDEMRLPSGGFAKHLDYWNADLDVHTFSFVSSNSCDPEASTFATLGVTAFSTFLEEPLHGILGIKPDGTLITHQFSVDEELERIITSRLRLPNNISLTGPGDEIYELTAVSEAYFNDFETAGDQTVAAGRLHFAAKMNVPFFEDLKAHIRSTSSRNTQPDSVVHLAGGWIDGDGNTYFDALFFDPHNRAYPEGVSEDLYFNLSGADGDPTPYLVRAQQKWLNVVPFDYALEWSPSLRSFTSYEPERETDLLVVKIDHQLDYLSAENAEITFGAVYQGMPRINLTNFTFNKIDEGTGVLKAMTDSLRAEAVGALEKGLDSLDTLLSDRIDELIDELLQQSADPIIDKFYAELRNVSETVDDINAWKQGVEDNAKRFLIENIEEPGESIQDVIKNLSDGVQSAASLVNKIDSSLEEVQIALRVINGKIYRVEGGVSIDPPNIPNPEAEAIFGLLTTDANNQFQIVETLVVQLIEEVAGDLGNEVATMLQNVLDGATSELNRLINEQIENVRPTLERIREVIGTVDGKIQLVRDQLQAGEEFIGELNAILASASQEVENATQKLKETVEGFVIADIPSPDQFIEISGEELKERIRTEIRDMIGEFRFMREYQLVLRQKLYDIDLAVKEGIDTAFAQVNLVIKNLLGEYLSQVDDKINGFLGDLGDSLGAGSLDGFAHINGDALRLLRLDAHLQLKVPDDLEFNGYLQIKQLNSDGSGSCSSGDPTSVVNEVTMGAIGVPVSWISPGMEIDVEGKASFTTGPFKPVGLGGSLEMVGGEFEFEAFAITDFGAAMSFGMSENYIAAKAGMRFQSYTIAGGVFFGQTCSIAPLKLVNEQVGSILGEPNPTFSGAYVYGEAHIPVSEVLLGIPASCMFKITAGVGVGAFYFVEGPTYGGQMLLAASGEALCLVSIKGDVSLVGVKVADDFRFSGRGRLEGRVGSCPFCVKFGKTLQLEYRNDRWKYEL